MSYWVMCPEQNFMLIELGSSKFILTIPSGMFANCHEYLLMRTNDDKLRPTYMHLKLELREKAFHSCNNAV